jgi:regulator of replication initiation timing
MSEDIVSRLNSSYAMLGDPLHKEAGGEIERLREKRDDWRAAMTENHDLWRENERLRTALQEISELKTEGPLSSDSMSVDYAIKIARGALAGEKK